MTSIDLVVFDMAGTTVDDGTAVPDSLHEAAVEFGLSVTKEEILTHLGTNKLHQYQMLIAREEGRDIPIEEFKRIDDPELRERAQQVFDRYSEIMVQKFHEEVKPMDGAEDTFRWLHDHDIKVVTNTGFHRAVTDVIIDKLGWVDRGLVDLVVDVDSVEGGIGRPSPFMIFHAMRELNVQSVKKVIKVGDTPSDMLEGTNAGCRGVVGVLSGPVAVEKLASYRHTHLIGSVKDLPALIEREF